LDLLLRSHPFEADCVCPECAEKRAESRLRAIKNFIDWANAPITAGLQRVERILVEGLDVPIDLSNRAGLRRWKKGVTTVRIGAHV
jgi:hypothetical protein